MVNGYDSPHASKLRLRINAVLLHFKGQKLLNNLMNCDVYNLIKHTKKKGEKQKSSITLSKVGQLLIKKKTKEFSLALVHLSRFPSKSSPGVCITDESESSPAGSSSCIESSKQAFHAKHKKEN